jgi:hypothetical protein
VQVQSWTATHTALINLRRVLLYQYSSTWRD